MQSELVMGIHKLFCLFQVLLIFIKCVAKILTDEKFRERKPYRVFRIFIVRKQWKFNRPLTPDILFR